MNLTKQRLIDADALIKSASTGCTDYVADELMDWIQGAPTVKAIPVEWLENKLETLCFEAMGCGGLYGDRIGELAKSINEVMKLWQKEQEKRP